MLFVFPEVLTPVLGPSCFIFAGFSLPCLVATATLDSFPLSCLPTIYMYVKHRGYNTAKYSWKHLP